MLRAMLASIHRFVSPNAWSQPPFYTHMYALSSVRPAEAEFRAYHLLSLMGQHGKFKGDQQAFLSMLQVSSACPTAVGQSHRLADFCCWAAADAQAARWRRHDLARPYTNSVFVAVAPTQAMRPEVRGSAPIQWVLKLQVRADYSGHACVSNPASFAWLRVINNSGKLAGLGVAHAFSQQPPGFFDSLHLLFLLYLNCVLGSPLAARFCGRQLCALLWAGPAGALPAGLPFAHLLWAGMLHHSGLFPQHKRREGLVCCSCLCKFVLKCLSQKC